jgi:O-antigen/teichoic acid export membrane protein
VIILDKQTLGRGAVYIYIQVIVTAISAYVFWLIISQLTSSEVIGTLSAIISITEILTSFAAVGIPDSIQRFLGKSFSEGKTEDSKIYVTAALFIISIGVIASSLFILIGGSFFELIEIDSNLQLVLILIIGSNAIQTLLNSIVISSLKTRMLALINIISSISKIVLSIIVVLLGSGAIGLAMTYLLVDNVLSSIMLGVIIITLLKPVPKKIFKPKISFTNATKDILIGGLATWIPILVTTIGYQLGTIILFGSKGSSDTGVYFLTLNIVNGILLSSNSLFVIALPALSSMQDGRKRLAWQTIRWSSLISMPLSSALVFYSQDIMQLFGASYARGELSLQILLLSVLPTIVANGVANLVYSYGNYKQSLAIDFAMNIPRTVLYFALIPVYGIFGGATSFSIGSLVALIVSMLIVSKIRMFIFWKELIVVSIIPLAIGYLLYALQINYVVGILITIVLSYPILLKLHIITRSDILDLLTVLPSSISNQILQIWKKKD